VPGFALDIHMWGPAIDQRLAPGMTESQKVNPFIPEVQTEMLKIPGICWAP
jgi:hypothetical protein